MYNAFIAAIEDGNDPTPAVGALLDATSEAIAKTDDPAGAGRGVAQRSVRPAGWRATTHPRLGMVSVCVGLPRRKGFRSVEARKLTSVTVGLHGVHVHA